MYHGTIEGFLPSIMKHGLDPGKHARGNRGVYVTGNKRLARYYAKSGAHISKEVHGRPSKGVILHLELPEAIAKSLKKDDVSNVVSKREAQLYKAFYTTKKIPVEYIRRAEKLSGFGMPKHFGPSS